MFCSLTIIGGKTDYSKLIRVKFRQVLKFFEANIRYVLHSEKYHQGSIFMIFETFWSFFPNILVVFFPNISGRPDLLSFVDELLLMMASCLACRREIVHRSCWRRVATRGVENRAFLSINAFCFLSINGFCI
jgi:hypothetical protein